MQVHRAVMQLKGKRRQVVVKVRHPGVAKSITVDFRLLKPVAAAASRIPSLKGLSLKESLAQFSANMTAQVPPCPSGHKSLSLFLASKPSLSCGLDAVYLSVNAALLSGPWLMHAHLLRSLHELHAHADLG